MATQVERNGNTGSGKWLHANGNTGPGKWPHNHTHTHDTYIHLKTTHTYTLKHGYTHGIIYMHIHNTWAIHQQQCGCKKLQHKLLHPHVDVHKYRHIIQISLEAPTCTSARLLFLNVTSTGHAFRALDWDTHMKPNTNKQEKTKNKSQKHSWQDGLGGLRGWDMHVYVYV